MMKMEAALTAKVVSTTVAVAAVPTTVAVAAVPAAASGQQPIARAPAVPQDKEKKAVILKLIQPKLLVPHGIDMRSQRGQFGWTTIGTTHLPYIFRNEDTRYVSLRIVNQQLFPIFFNVFRQSLFDMFRMRSNQMTEPERCLYNEINTQHCDGQYGLNSFQRDERLLVLHDVEQLYVFLEFIHRRLIQKKCEVHPNYGYINLNLPVLSVIPFCLIDGVRYVPMMYFEGDLMYLNRFTRPLDMFHETVMRFLMRLQYVSEPNQKVFVISLDEVRKYMAPGKKYDQVWIDKENDVFTSKLPGTSAILRVINSDEKVAIFCNRSAT